MIPLFVGVANPALGTLATAIETEAEKLIAQKMVSTGQTREQVLAEAAELWDKDIKDAEDLRRQGHT